MPSNRVTCNLLPCSGELPLPRFAHGAAFLQKPKSKQQIIVFGGYTNKVESDMYKFSVHKCRWKKVNFADGDGTPCERANHSVVVRYRVNSATLCEEEPLKLVIFGGMNASGRLNDMFEFDLGTKCWSKVEIRGLSVPKPRATHSGVVRYVHATDERLVVFAGWNGYNYVSMLIAAHACHSSLTAQFNDLWEFSFQTHEWTALPNTQPPCPRNTHCAVMRNRHVMVVFGGNLINKRFNDLYEYSFKTFSWTRIEPQGSVVPTERGAARAAMIPGRDKLLVYGGKQDSFHSTKLNDMYVFDFAHKTWIQVLPDPIWQHSNPGYPPRLSSFVLFFSSCNGASCKILCFGGCKNDDSYSNQVWQFTLDSNDAISREQRILSMLTHKKLTDVLISCTSASRHQPGTTSCISSLVVQTIGYSFGGNCKNNFDSMMVES